MSSISIIVPCYNQENSLPRCINSLLRQTKPVEIILVNDGSTDGSLSVMSAFEKRYNNIRVISSNNQGLPQSRKTGLLAATTPFVAFLDADDWVDPDMYQRLYYAIMHTQSDLAFCGTVKSYVHNKQVPLKQTLADGVILTGRQALHYLHCRCDVYPYMWNKLFRKDLLFNIVFPADNFIGEDYVVLIQILLQCNSVVSVRKPMHHYFQGASSMSKGGFSEKHILSYAYYQKTDSFLAEYDASLKNDVCCYLAIEYMSLVVKMFRNRNFNYQLISEIRDYISRHRKYILHNPDYHFVFKIFTICFLLNYKITCKMYCLGYNIFKHFNRLT